MAETRRVPLSHVESPLMYEVLDHQSSSTNTSGSSLGSSVTACKKILCSNSLLESTDYWLQNQRTPCRIGIVEDKLEKNYASVCFVNLDACKDDCSDEHMKQRLISVSPNLPKLISSMNVQPPKENEIILLSGLTSGNLQEGFEVPQCSWLADVCLVQCARGNRKNSTSCIIFEINKFLIGLELVQEKQLRIEASVLKPEDDTNCSVSSIEEDFLTASEHFEDENEADDDKNDQEKLNDSGSAAEFRNYKDKELENLHCRKAWLSSTLETNYINQDSPTPARTSSLSEEDLIDEDSQTVGKTVNELHCKADITGKSKPSTKTDDLENSSRDETNNSDISEDASLVIMAKEEIIYLDDAGTEHSSHPNISACREERKPHHPMHNEQITAGEFATNLAESVLQDAFIRLSQSSSTKEAAISISAGNSLTSSAYAAQDIIASRSWNELPKIVIVQSPDGSENNASEWPGSSLPNVGSCSEAENSTEVTDWVHDSSSSESTQSALEVALTCAATVIGTISSPHAAESLKKEQESTNSKSDMIYNGELEAESSQSLSNCTSVSYSFPSALCGMTQVASAVAVCGLGERKGDQYPVTSSGLLSAAEASTAITLHCSIAVGSSMENLNHSIAHSLFKEASLVLTKPETYKNIGDFMESINGKIVQAVTKPPVPHLDEVIVDELAQNLSNVILRHTVEEVRQKQLNTGLEENIGKLSTQDIFIATANKFLFNILYFTCKKMNEISQLGECSDTFAEGNLSWQVMECQPREVTNDLTQQFSNYSTNKPFHDTDPDKDLVSLTHVVKDSKGEVMSGPLEVAKLHSDLSPRASAHSSPSERTSPKKRYSRRTARECYKSAKPGDSQIKKELQSFTGRENTTTSNECRHGIQELHTSYDAINTEVHEKHTCDAAWHHEDQIGMSILGNQGFLPSPPLLQLKYPADKYCIADFAEELAETVVSMATEIAAICLDNSNGKQPWFCAWKRGSEYLMPQALSCRTIKRKKETQPNGSVVRKHRPPRLSEIKRKTDEHPELKEKLMNRVVDESINLDDTPDSSFANEVAAKIMNLAECSVADNVWQSPNHPRNRLHCDKWSRVNASSCESIPEEDSDSKGSANTLGILNTLGQPMSRTSSVSKQSSCESITDEFSRFMVNQMENEGREFDLLLDYYAGKNANNILTSALQQVSKKNGHLSVRPSCPSKQSSTESITEEFYRYMLKEIEKENMPTGRSAKDWNSSLLPPSQRSPFCFRQSSMPDSRSSVSRLTVNVPIKANSLDGFSRNGHRDSLNVLPVDTVSSSGLCKSDSYLYQRCRTDQVTDVLIHETWSNSIKALMCKNKIIVGDEEGPGSDQPLHDSPPHVQLYANKLAANIVESGKTLIAVHQDSANRNQGAESRHVPIGMQKNYKPVGDRVDLTVKRHHSAASGLFPTNHMSSSACLREVPLIQIETDHREDFDKGSEPLMEDNITAGKTREPVNKEKPSEADWGRHMVSVTNSSLNMRSSPDTKAVEEFPVPLSSSDDSTGSSWCQLANDEDNPDDTSSYLQFSERSMSNGNSSTTSSLGMMDLEIYQENMSSSHTINELVEECTFQNKQPEAIEGHTSSLSMGTANGQKDLLVINFDLEPECPDAELRATLQWIAASELGIPIIYFKKSQENRIEKFLDVVQLVHQKSWKVGDIFHAVVQFCKLHEESREPTPSLFDWLLELG